MTEQEAQAERAAQSALAKYDQWDEHSDAPHPGTGWEHVRALLRSRVVAAPSDAQADEAIDILNDPQYEYAAMAMREILRRAMRGTSQPVQEGHWERCTPGFINGGGVCAAEPRRALWEHEKKDPDDVGHCHWIASQPVQVEVTAEMRSRAVNAVYDLGEVGTNYIPEYQANLIYDVVDAVLSAALGGGE